MALFSQGVPVPNPQAEIDNEIAVLAERLRAHKTHRNSFSPISSIPPETLGAVFVHLSRKEQSLQPPNYPAVSWLNVTHVCRHWREVAIANPHLWATPFLGSLEITEEMLMRSKSVPLILRSGSRFRNDCIQKVFEHVERLQEVFLDCSNSPTHYILGLLDKLSSCSAPSLRSFSLDGGRNRMPLVAIPTSFMAPNLRELQISHCDLPWASPILTRVTVLNINTVSDQCLPTLDGLISTLRRMSALHTLSLEGALPALPPGTKSLPITPPAMHVQLPHLERLRLVGKLIEVANVLACVELPVSTRLEVQLVCRIISDGDSDGEWNLGLPIISRALECCFNVTPNKSQQFARSMRLSGYGHFRVQYSTVRHPTSWVRPRLEAPMEWTSECPVTLDFRFPDEPSREIVKIIWKLVPLGRLEALYIEDNPQPCWDGFLDDVLGRTARKLSHIYFRGSQKFLGNLFKSLRSQNLKHSVSRIVDNRPRRRPIFFPALSHLAFEDPVFSTFMVGKQPLDLRDVLIDRVNDGRGLDKLTITRCIGIGPRDVQLLREVVADVEWDEYEGSDSDDDEFDSDEFDDEDDDDDDDDDSEYGYSFW